MTAEEIIIERRRLAGEISALECKKPPLPEVRAQCIPQVGFRINEDGDIVFFIAGEAQRISMAINGAYRDVSRFFSEGSKLFPLKDTP